MQPLESQFPKHVVIVGVGLIGGSIAAAVRQRFPDCRITGVGRSTSRLAACVDFGLIDDGTTKVVPDEIHESAVIVVCLPVDLIAATVISIAKVVPDSVLVTDAGSVKRLICDAVEVSGAASRFVGAHPIAGSDRSGFEHAETDLFVDRACIVTPQSGEARSGNTKSVDRIAAFWRAIGCRVTVMSPAQHDRMLAYTSHLPHLMAAAAVAAIGADRTEFAGSGYADTTRVAAGSPQLWRQILSGNARDVVAALSDAERILRDYRHALESGNADCLELLLSQAAEIRRRSP